MHQSDPHTVNRFVLVGHVSSLAIAVAKLVKLSRELAKDSSRVIRDVNRFLHSREPETMTGPELRDVLVGLKPH